MKPEARILHRYDDRSILLHWITAFLVILLWCAGQTIDWFPRGTPRVSARSLHISFGILLGCIALYRIWWRHTGGRHLPPAGSGALQAAASVMHFLLYAGILATVTLGVANVWVRGDTIFQLVTIPKFDPANKPLRETVEKIHEVLANALLILAALHAAIALVHHYFWKDEVLLRMLPQAIAKRFR